MKQEDRFFRLMHAVDDDLLEEAMQPVRRRRHVWIPLGSRGLPVASPPRWAGRAAAARSGPAGCAAGRHAEAVRHERNGGSCTLLRHNRCKDDHGPRLYAGRPGGFAGRGLFSGPDGFRHSHGAGMLCEQRDQLYGALRRRTPPPI